MSERYDAAIVLSGDLDADGNIGPESRQRTNTAIYLYEEDVVSHLVMSGGWPMRVRTEPVITAAEGMESHALGHGVPDEAIYIEPAPRETIGDAYFTKTNIVQPMGWEKLLMVTANSHLKRATKVFKHVYGPDYIITPIPSGEVVPRSARWLHEIVGEMICFGVLGGTKPGDHEAVYKRLCELVPGYDEVPAAVYAKNWLARIFGPALLGSEFKSW